MQAKNIPEVPVLQFWDNLNGQHATWFDNNGALFDNSVQHAMPLGTPAKVALAKMKTLIRQGLVDGCACGCRGDFVITDMGKSVLARISN